MATKARKQEIVTELQDFFNQGKLAIVTDLSGFTVSELTSFRRKLSKDHASCRIAKNTLIKIASKGSEFEPVGELSKGPSAIVVGYEDPAAPAKTTVEFLKLLKKGTVRGGVIDGKLITSDEVKSLASLPSKELLLSSIMGGLDSGARGVSGILEGVIRDLAVLIEEAAKKNQAA